MWQRFQRQSQFVKPHESPHRRETLYLHNMWERRNDLSRHMRIHIGKPFICNNCGKGFIEKTNLSSHSRIHTDEKPYICKTCGKAFRLKKYFSNHTRIHIGEKPYNCKTCGKAFIQKTSLSVHLKVHTGNKY